MSQAGSSSLPARSVPIDASAFRQAAGQFLTGVTVVTTLAPDGTPRGFTANSFTSVSLDPPLVLTCIGKASRSYDAFAAADAFAIHVLGAEQKALSATFASRAEDKFAGVDWTRGPDGAPVLPGCLARFDCVLHQRIEAGDHLVLIGRVVALERTTGTPLGYFAGNYVDFAVQRESAGGGRAERTRFGALLRQDEALLFERTPRGLTLPFADTLDEEDGTRTSLVGTLGAQGIAVSLNFAYSVFTEEAGAVLNTVYLGDVTVPPGEVPAPYVMLRPSEIPFETLGRFQEGLVRRYLREREQDVFGLYVGTLAKGMVHRLPQRPR